jgi:transmembrane sensor
MAPALMAAAAIALLAAVRFHDSWSGSPGEPAAIAQVEPGLLHLSDGSEVEVHAGGEIVEQFTPEERRVRLVRGEAYFTVARNPARPFVVEASGVAVRAIGTAFNVRLRPDATTVEVLVTEGKVQIAPPNSRAFDADTGSPSGGFRSSVDLTPHLEDEVAILTAGQRTVISTRVSAGPRMPVIETLAAAEIDRALSWQTGRFILDATPLAEVVERFNRHAAGRQALPRLTVADPQLGKMRISGRIRAENIESFVEVLETNFGVVAERRVEGEIILKRR